MKKNKAINISRVDEFRFLIHFLYNFLTKKIRDDQLGINVQIRKDLRSNKHLLISGKSTQFGVIMLN